MSVPTTKRLAKATEPFSAEIRNALGETPRCHNDPACVISTNVSAAMRTAP